MEKKIIRYGKAYRKKTTVAADELTKLQSRALNPYGDFDEKGRWYPSEKTERCECCDYVRSPSVSWPYSLMKHCRTAKHVASKHGLEEADVRACAKDKDKWLKKANKEDKKRLKKAKEDKRFKKESVARFTKSCEDAMFGSGS